MTSETVKPQTLPTNGTGTKKKPVLLSKNRAAISEDFVADYVKYADGLELPTLVHEFVAITAIAALVNGKVWIKAGRLTIPLDFWTLLVCPSGGGRNTTVRPLRELLHDAAIGDLLSRESWGSFPAMQQMFADRGDKSGLHVWTEMSQMLLDLRAGHFRGALQFITDLFDETQAPQGKRYREAADEEDETPTIEFTAAPRLSLLSTSSPAWLNQSLTENDIRGGFMPRWCPVLTDAGPPVPWVEESDRNLKQPLINKIKQLASFNGIVNFEPWRQAYDQWYRAARDRFIAKGDMAHAFFNRHRNYCYKLAVIAELSKRKATNDVLTISPAAWEQALKWSRLVEESIFKLLERGFSNEGIASVGLEKVIQDAGPVGYTKAQFSNTYRGSHRKIAHDRLQTLVDAEIVHPFKRNTSGREAWVLVHHNHFAEHKRRASLPIDDPEKLRDGPPMPLWPLYGNEGTSSPE